MKKLSLMIAGLLVSSQTYALGLGNPQLHSYLGEPLHVSVPLLLSADEQASLAQLRAAMGDRAMFERMDMEYREIFQRIRVSVKQQGKDTWLLLHSEHQIAEPLLEFPLLVSIGGNRLVRGVTLLLDPPGVTTSLPATPIRPAATQATGQARHTGSTAPVMPTTKPRAVTAMPVVQTNGRYAPVQINQTLGEIAQKLRPEAASLNQTMVALWQANPDVFIKNNMNRLMAGSRLQIPTNAEILAIPSDIANREVVAQYREFRGGVRSIPVTPTTDRTTTADEKRVEPMAPQPAAQPSSQSPAAATSVPDDKARLSLLAPSNLNEIPEVFHEEVKLLGSRLRTLDDENSELRGRILDLERHIATLSQQMVVLVENTLAAGKESEDIAGVIAQLDTGKSTQQTHTDDGILRQTQQALEMHHQEVRAVSAIDSTLAPTQQQPKASHLIRYVVIGGVLLLSVGVAGIWYRRLRQRERYRDIMYRF